MLPQKKLKKKVHLPRFVGRNQLKLAWNEQEQCYSPTRLFAFWHKSALFAAWKETQLLTGNSLKHSLNYPDYVLRNFDRWWIAMTDFDYTITVPWDEFDVWLKRNGFTGCVDKNYISSKKSKDAGKSREKERSRKGSMFNCNWFK